MQFEILLKRKIAVNIVLQKEEIIIGEIQE